MTYIALAFILCLETRQWYRNRHISAEFWEISGDSIFRINMLLMSVIQVNGVARLQKMCIGVYEIKGQFF